MIIGIDISQIAYEQTGVSDYLRGLVEELLRIDKSNEYVLFFSSLRRSLPKLSIQNPRVTIKKFKFPPTVLDFIWNRLHILSIEKLIGDVDLFITSDWTEPPSSSKKATIIYDLSVYKYPKEMAKKIVDVQKRKLKWVKKESDVVFCISEATKKDAGVILGIEENKLKVIYPGA